MEIITSFDEGEAVHSVALDVAEQAMYDVPETLPLDLFRAIAAASAPRRERKDMRQTLMRAAKVLPQTADVLHKSLQSMDKTDPCWQIDAQVERRLAEVGLGSDIDWAAADDSLE